MAWRTSLIPNPHPRSDGNGEPAIVYPPITSLDPADSVLTGRVAIVTGAARGIGAAAAVALANAGAHVALIDLHPTEQTSKKIQDAGGLASGHLVDVTDEDAVRQLVEELLRVHGRIDVLVNNVGLGDRVPIDQVDAPFFAERMNTNVWSAFNCIKAVLPTMSDQGGGKIITISSVSAKVGGVSSRDPRSGEGRSGPTYAATKAALIGLTRWIAKDAGQFGIHANAICPGPIATPAIDGAEYDLSQTPLHRLGTPSDIGAVVAFLASPAANYLTGQTINVDGGLRMD